MKSESQWILIFEKASPPRSLCFCTKAPKTKPKQDMKQDQKIPTRGNAHHANKIENSV